MFSIRKHYFVNRTTTHFWVAYKERMEKAPWLNAFWIFAKNVTFEKCLWALNVQSNTFITYVLDKDEGEYELDFELKPLAIHGIVRLDGNSQLTWLVNLYNYKSTPHLQKEKSTVIRSAL